MRGSGFGALNHRISLLVGEYKNPGGQAAAFSTSRLVFATLKRPGYQVWNFAFRVRSSTRVLVWSNRCAPVFDQRICCRFEKRLPITEPPRVYRRVKLSKDEPYGEKKSPPKYTAEFRARGVRLYKDHRADYASDNAAYHAIAPKLGCSPDSLRVWCQQAERDAGERDGLTSEQKARLKVLERENKELRTANEILKKASAYFAQAELDRPFRK